MNYKVQASSSLLWGNRNDIFFGLNKLQVQKWKIKEDVGGAKEFIIWNITYVGELWSPLLLTRKNATEPYLYKASTNFTDKHIYGIIQQNQSELLSVHLQWDSDGKH